MEDSKSEQQNHGLDVLYIELTNRCNLSCVHCGNGDYREHELPFETVCSMIYDFKDKGGSKLMFTGGEPLLYPRLEEILNLSSSYPGLVKISSNGLDILNPKYDFILDHDIGFKLSLDGNRHDHNSIRQNIYSYDNLIQSMRKISKHNKQITVRSTLMRQNMYSVIDMLFEMDELSKEGVLIDRINIWPIRNIGRAKSCMMLTPEEYKDFIGQLKKRTCDWSPSFGVVVGPIFGAEEEFTSGPVKRDEIYQCNLLNKTVHVAANGDVYPCSFVQFPLGNVLDKKITDIFNSEEATDFRRMFLQQKGKLCPDCDYHASCGGGCCAENYTKLLKGEPTKDIYCFRRDNSAQ